MNISIRFALILALCALPLLVGELTVSKEEAALRPVALSFSKTGDLFVLDADGRVMVIPRSDQSRRPRVIATLSGSWQVSDLAVGGSDGEDHVFIIVTKPVCCSDSATLDPRAFFSQVVAASVD